MPRVHTQKAAKDYPESGITKGQTYYKWEFRYGGVRRSATYPRQSELTQSAFLSGMYQIQESIQHNEVLTDFDSIQDDIDGLKSSIEELRDQCQESLDNMPESLQYGSTGELLQERIDAMGDWYNEFDSVVIPTEEDVIEEIDMDEEIDCHECGGRSTPDDEVVCGMCHGTGLTTVKYNADAIEERMAKLKEEKLNEVREEVSGFEPCCS